MTKVCPFQSDSQGSVHCDEADCMAWGTIQYLDSDTPDSGYCKLIDRS